MKQNRNRERAEGDSITKIENRFYTNDSCEAQRVSLIQVVLLIMRIITSCNKGNDMTKQLLTPLLILSSLNAEGIDPDELNSIYIEAALFVTVFGLMSVASFIISRKHAKQNALKDLQKKKSQEEAKKNSQASSVKHINDAAGETNRVKELSKMLKDGLITDEEFQALKGVSK